MENKNINKTNQDRQTDTDDQAMNFDIFERKLEEEFVFGRRSSIARTPPPTPSRETSQQETEAAMCDIGKSSVETLWQEDDLTSPTYKLVGEVSLDTSFRARANSLPGENARSFQPKTLDLMQERKKAAKRLRDEEVEEDTQNLRKEVDRLLKTVRELSDLTEASSKTKTEIKNLVKKLKRQANDVDKEWKLLDAKEVKARPKEEIKETRTIGVQTSVGDIEKEYEEKRTKMTNKIQAAMKENSNFGKLADILDVKWPQEIYKITEMEGANVSVTSGLQGDFAIITDPKNADGNKLVEKLQVKYSGLNELITSNEGQVDYLIQTARVKTRRNEYEENSSAVYLIPLTIDKAGVNDMELLYNKIKEFKETTQVHPSKLVNLVIGEGLKPSYTRKICEYAFANVDIKIRILLQGSGSNPSRQKTRREDTMVRVSAEGKSYVDMVKKLKEKVDIDQIGVRVTKIRKSDKGDLLLQVEGGQAMASTLEKEIKSKIEDVKVTTRKLGTITIYVIGVDPTISKEDVTHALAMETKLQEADINIKSIRKGKYDEQTIIAEIPKQQQVTDLIKRRKMRIGWTECGVRERIEVTRCFKCLEYGHRSWECTSQVDRSEECVKCGQKGHKGKDCTNRARCIKCNADGHRADQIKCPYFKELVEGIRRQKMQLTTTRPKNNSNNNTKTRKQNTQVTDAKAREDKNELNAS